MGDAELKQAAEDIVFELDSIEREYDGYDYGLPTHCEECMLRMTEAVIKTILKATSPSLPQSPPR